MKAAVQHGGLAINGYATQPGTMNTVFFSQVLCVK